MNRRLSVVSLCLLFLLLAGCQTKSQDSLPNHPPVQRGLGLQIPTPLPEPGPFLEGEENVTAMAQALRQTFSRIIEGCEDPMPEAMAFLESYLHERNFPGALHNLVDACRRDWVGEVHGPSDAARRNGTEAGLHERMRARAIQALREEADVLSRMGPPGSLVDADLQATLMHINAFHFLSMETAQSSFEDYLQTGNEHDLYTAILNYWSTFYSRNVTRDFVQFFPWAKGACMPPDMTRLQVWLGAKIEEILNRSVVLEPPSEGLPVDEIYGSTLKGSKPTLLYFSERSWWPGLMSMVSSVSHDAAILDTHAENRLPTLGESKYLWALHQHSRRTLDTEAMMQGFSYQLETAMDWQEEFLARKALALEHMEWGFKDLRCTPMPA